MPKVVHLSSVHPAQDTRILHRECRSLVEAGYEVVLIANAEGDYEEHGVCVRAIPANPGGRLVRMTRQVLRVGRMALNENADLYHFHDPELIPLALFLRLRGKLVIYDVHESMSKLIMSKAWIPRGLRTFVANCYRLLEKATAHAFNGIVVATPGIANYFPESKTTLVQNFPRLDELLPVEADSITEREPMALYIGEVSESRGAVDMVDAMELLPPDSQMKLVIAGSVRPESLKDQLDTDGVDLLGVIGRRQVAEYLCRACVGLVVLHPEPNFVDSYPVKLFEYMAAGVPVVASKFPFWRQFVEDIGSGVMVDPGNPQAIAEGIQEIVDNPELARVMGESGVAAVRDRFNWDMQSTKLLVLYERLLSH